MASTYLTQTISSSTGKKFTLSMWVKRANVGSSHMLFHLSSDSGNTDYLDFAIKNNDKLDVQLRNGSSTTYYRKRTNRLFRDTSAWYHLVWRFDSTNSTADDRWIMYINGERATDIDLDGTPSQVSSDYVTPLNRNGATLQIGTNIGGSLYFDGCLSHVHLCDGYSYAPTEFGETDSTTGEWKIKTSPSVSYGTNGFFIFKDDNAVTDRSGQGNNFTLGGGTLTKTEDCPSNVFATLSPNILPRNSGGTISNGNLFFGTSAAQWTTESSAFGITNGKYYFEVKLKDNGSDRRFRWGLQKNAEIIKTGNNKVLGGSDNNAIGYATGGESATQGSYFINQSSTTMSDGDINENNAIYGFAIDLDNQKMYGHMNGTYFHSGNPSAGSGGIDVSSFYTVGEPLFPSFTVHNSNLEINFGNGYFGTTAVASAGSNASNIGIFEYDVPTGYTALSTKGLNE